MTPTFRKSLIVTTIAFAIIGVLVCLIVLLALLSDRKNEMELDADTRLLTEIYDGVGTRFGLVSRYVETDMGKTTVRHQLYRILAREDSADGKRQVLVIGFREMRPEISTKVEAGSIEIAKVAAAGTIDMLVDADHAFWKVYGTVREKQNGKWLEVASGSVIDSGELGEAPPTVRFPKLSAKVPGFMLQSSSGGEQYYQLQDKNFNNVLDLGVVHIDDLDDCLAHRQRAQREKIAQAEKVASKPQEAESSPAAAQEEETLNEDMPEEVPDFWCARVTLHSKILPSMSHGYHDIEVIAEGEGAARKQQTKRYVFRFFPRYKVYAFGETADHHANNDVMADFVAQLP